MHTGGSSNGLTLHLHSVEERSRHHAHKLSNQHEHALRLVITDQIGTHAAERGKNVIADVEHEQTTVGVNSNRLDLSIDKGDLHLVGSLLFGHFLTDEISKEEKHETDADGNSDDSSEAIVVIVVIVVIKNTSLKSTKDSESTENLLSLSSILVLFPSVGNHMERSRNNHVKSNTQTKSKEYDQQSGLSLLSHREDLGNVMAKQLYQEQNGRIDQNGREV